MGPDDVEVPDDILKLIGRNCDLKAIQALAATSKQWNGVAKKIKIDCEYLPPDVLELEKILDDAQKRLFTISESIEGFELQTLKLAKYCRKANSSTYIFKIDKKTWLKKVKGNVEIALHLLDGYERELIEAGDLLEAIYRDILKNLIPTTDSAVKKLKDKTYILLEKTDGKLPDAWKEHIKKWGLASKRLDELHNECEKLIKFKISIVSNFKGEAKRLRSTAKELCTLWD